jgi:hypothetical protein
MRVKCLWSKLEADSFKENIRNWRYPVFPPIKPNHIK